MRVYRSILVPLDGSALAERGLTVGAALAARFGSRLRLVHVVHQHVADEFASYGRAGDAAPTVAENYVVGAAARVRAAQGGDVSGVVLHGSAAGSIAGHVAVAGADLIVMSSHGRTGASRFWLGSVADAVIRSAAVPVLMVRAPADDAGARDAGATRNPGMFPRVLVPLDGSAVAEAVLAHAFALAKLDAGHVHLLQVEERAEDLRASVWGLAARDPDDLSERLRRADHYLHALIARFELQWRPATVSAEARGDRRIGEAIAQVALEREINLIAMATHGRGARRLLLGSVADKAIRGTDCSILLYHGR